MTLQPINQYMPDNESERGRRMTAESPVFQWLRAGVPLSLLLDLVSPDGPDSRAIARSERR